MELNSSYCKERKHGHGARATKLSLTKENFLMLYHVKDGKQHQSETTKVVKLELGLGLCSLSGLGG